MPLMPMKKLLPKKIMDAMPAEGATAGMGVENIVVPLKLFDGRGCARWYLYEYNPEDRVFWCFANLGDDMCAELGTVALDELLTVPMLERDIYWNPKTTLKEIIDFKKR